MEKINAITIKRIKLFLSLPIPADNKEVAKRFLPLINRERIQNAIKGVEEVSDADAVLALSVLSLQAPLNDDFSRIFIAVAAREVKKLGEKISDVIPPEDTYLSNYLEEKFHVFKRELFYKLKKVYYEKISHNSIK